MSSSLQPHGLEPTMFSVHEISQARILKWVVISSSRGSSWPWDWTHISCIGRQILYHWTIFEALGKVLNLSKIIPIRYLLTIPISKFHGAIKRENVILCLMCRAYSLSLVWLFEIPWTVACQAPLSMGLQARILERVAMPSSRGSSQPRDQTQVSRTAGRFFTIWAPREAQYFSHNKCQFNISQK